MMHKMYFLGPAGTYSERAAKKTLNFLGGKFELEPVSTICKIVDFLNRNEDEAGILPIENSIEGIVRQSIDSLYLSDVKIQAQTEIKIEHCLLSKGKKSHICHIISHPQALAQCQRYILENFDKNIDLISANSTAAAALMLLEKDSSYGAIASLEAAKNSDFNVLDENIGDFEENKTRFVLVSKKKLEILTPTRTSIVFNTKNKPGALFSILKIFNNHNLNLIYIESRPSKRVFGEYNFFVDIDGGIDEIAQALDEIKQECNFYKLLGSYCVF